MIADIAIIYALLLAATFLFAAIGRFFSGQGKNISFRLSESIVIGSVVLGTLYAIISTGGKSIFLLSVWPLFRLYSTPQGSIKDLTKPLLSFACFLLFTVLLFVFFMPWSGIETDLFFYGTIAEWLPLNGEENYFHYFLSDHSDLSGSKPYHYFELWLASLVNRLTGLSGVTALRYAIYPYFSALVLFMMSAVFRSRQWMWFLGILALAALPLNQVLNWIGGGVWALEWSFLSRSNLLFYLFILLPAWRCYTRKDYVRASYWIMLLPIISITTAPSIFVWMGLTLLYSWWKGRDAKDLKLLLEWIGLGLLIGAFYILTGAKAKLQGEESLVELLAYSWSIKKAIIGVSLILFLRLSLLSALLWVLAKANGKHKTWIWALGLTMVGVIEFQVFSHVDNMYQIPYVGYSLLWLILVLSLIHSITKLKAPFQLLLIALLVIGATIFNRDSFKFGVQDNLSEWAFASHGHVLGETVDIEQIKTNPRVLFVLPEHMGELGFSPKRRQALTSQLGSEYHWLIDRLELYPATPAELLYSEPADYGKARAFNRYLKYYREGGSKEAEAFARQNNYKWILRSSVDSLLWEEVK